MRPRLVPIALAGVLALALAASAAARTSLAGATSWRDTATKGLSLEGTALGPLAASTPLHVSVALALRNRDALQQSIRSGAQLTPSQFAATYAPTSSDAQAVASYLQSAGFGSVAIEPNRLFVTATGTAAAADKAFNTTILRYQVQGRQLYANATAAQVPSTLGSALSVLGLNDAATMTPPLRKADTGVPNYITDYTPQGFWKAYDATTAATGSKTPIAIFAEGDLSGVVSDLRTEETANKLAQVPVSVVQVGTPSPDTAGADEWDMDTQYSTGMAATVSKLYLYDTTSLTDADVTLEFNRFVTDDKASAGSASFGECEYQAYLDGSMVAMDQVFNEAAAQGQTVFASSGDTGGFCPVAPNNGVPAGVPDVNYPAASPYVVAVGGTTLLTNADGTYDNELAWLAGGGGPSLFEYQPWWQSGVAPPTGSTCVEVVACAGKTVPDVAMDADPNSGAAVYVGGTPEAVGGTSLSSPLALGVWARLQSANGNKLGFASPRLYAANGSAGYHDVILGDTGPYPATPGYDLATGMGTFDVARMATAIGASTTPAVVTLAKPACTSFTDKPGDSKPTGSTGNADSLDVLAGGFAANGSNVTAKLMVKSLSSGPVGTPQISGAGDVWYVVWSDGTTQHYLSAEYPGTTVDLANPGVPVDYSYGDIQTSPTGGALYNTDGTATGSVDPVTGVLTITAPASVFGVTTTSTLGTPSAQTFESIGTPATGGLLEPADSAGPGSSIRFGTSC